MKDDNTSGTHQNPHPKLFTELSCLMAEYEKAREIYPIARAQFIRALNRARARQLAKDSKDPSSSPPIPPMDPKLLEENSSATIVEDKDVKKIFRKIAKETHPDAIIDEDITSPEAQKRIEMFQDARRASQEKDWYSLFKIADELGIQLAKTSQEYRNVLKLAIKSVKANIIEIYQDPAWVWYYSHPKQKVKIINHFIKSGV